MRRPGKEYNMRQVFWALRCGVCITLVNRVLFRVSEIWFFRRILGVYKMEKTRNRHKGKTRCIINRRQNQQEAATNKKARVMPRKTWDEELIKT